MIVRCTRKVLDQLPPDTPIGAPPATDDDWYLNLLWIERRKCVLLAHARTLFAVFRPTMRKAALRDLNGGSADLADYAGDPVAMAEALRASLGSNRTAVDLFNKIGQLLYPMFGAPPEVRRALLRVLLTQVEGVRIASVTARDLSGRRGVLAELADGTATTGILFDPDLAEPLGQVTDSNDSRPRHTESDWSTPTIVPAIDQRPDGTRVPPRK